MLKHVVTATEYATLTDTLKPEYVVQIDGSYKLDLGPMFVTDKDPKGLLSALESEREEHKKTKEHVNRFEKERDDALAAAKLTEAQKSGDIEAIKKLMLDQQEALKTQFNQQLEVQKQQVLKQQQSTAEQLKITEAQKIASELFGTKAALALPHILNQIHVEPGEQPVVQFRDASGTPDLLATQETFKKSFLTNPMFADMVVVSKASGGSANDGTGSVSPQKPDGTRKGFNDYAPGDLVKLRKENQAEYDRLKAERDSQRSS